jgi:prepilin-type N-terminal cleavage/methylation domain-containing protein
MNHRTLLQPTRRHASDVRGFTLVELMITIAVVGVLATLALVSYKKYIDGARVSEPLSILQAMRTSQEQVRRETGHYLDVTQQGYFPMKTGFGDTRTPWGGADAQGHGDYARWRQLDVPVSGTVLFGYKANAGLSGKAISLAVDFKPAPTWPNPPSDDWYVLQAKGDPDKNGAPTVLITSSYTTTVAMQEDMQ